MKTSVTERLWSSGMRGLRGKLLEKNEACHLAELRVSFTIRNSRTFEFLDKRRQLTAP